MTVPLEPLLHPVRIADLRPTQMTVGLEEVALKRVEWRSRVERDGAEYLGRHMIPVVVGPKQRFHLIDHHHLARALFEEGVEHVLVRIEADLHRLSGGAFDTFMENRNWVHPYDADGKRRPCGEMPKHIGKLTDDPYRSLAGAVRRAGGCAKDETPYAEFLWADYLRRKLRRKDIEKGIGPILDKAVRLARSRDADYLPGWAGQEN
jgi:hypothetical protein